MWYYVRKNKSIGPVGEEEMLALIQNGKVNHPTLVWKDGMKEWLPAGTTELSNHFSSTLPNVYASLVTNSSGAATYEPQSFKKLWIWFVGLIGAGLPLSFVGIGIVPLIAGCVIGYILLYRFWDIIQDGQARTSPGKAVGFCFIPFYNFYWNFVAFAGLAKDMNAYCDEHNIQGPRVNERVAFAWCCLAPLGIIPYVGIVTSIAGFVIWMILYKQLTDTATNIMESKTR